VLRILALTAVAVVAALAGLTVQPASAATGMLVGLYDDGQTLFNGRTAFPTFKKLGVQMVRVQLRWGGPGGVALRRPRRAADPGDPAYDWAPYDRAVKRAKTARIKVVFSIYGTPRWENHAQGYNRAPRRSADLRNFAYAAAVRYSGMYRLSAKARPLPAVKHWLAWNEPNNPVFLKPQFKRAGRTWVYQAARDYAKMCAAIYEGVHLTGLRNEKVGCGVTAPRGNNQPLSDRPSTSPITFLREVKKAGLRRFDAWAHHPYYGSKLETPRTPPRAAPRAVTLGNLNVLIKEITRLYGARRFWITEYGYQTNPPDEFFGVSWAKQATYLSQAFALARKNPRVDMMLWYLLQDEPSLGGWQSGLQTTHGRLKPAFKAYQRLPR
jgi:hypothetical protein